MFVREKMNQIKNIVSINYVDDNEDDQLLLLLLFNQTNKQN